MTAQLTQNELVERLVAAGIRPDDDSIDVWASYLDQKLAAMRAHATQIAVDSQFFAFSDNVGQRAFGREYYTLLAGPRGRGSGPRERESDLFAGLG